MAAAAEQLETALGHEVKVRPRGEIAVEMRFESLDEALALRQAGGAAQRLSTVLRDQVGRYHRPPPGD